MYIASNEMLENFCNSLNSAEFISIDTEFCRNKTYYPQLCLIQIATANKAVIIDALNKDIDLNILRPIFQNANIVKVFHSAKQDLEILYYLYKELPLNIFDTQVAAAFCGMGDSLSYESLVSNVLNIKIDKSHCLSDWTKRPLTKQQIEYALGDVTYLYQIYSYLINMLKQNARFDWVMEEMESLNKVENFVVNLDQVWTKLKNTQGIKINLVLKKLTAWREKKAQNLNLPRNHFLSEQHLFDLSNNMPITLLELKKIKHFSLVTNEEGVEIIELIQEALAEQLKQDLSSEATVHTKINTDLLHKLKSLLNLKAQEYSLPTNIIATSQEIKNISAEENFQSRVAKGWRYKVFGEEAMLLKGDFLKTLKKQID